MALYADYEWDVYVSYSRNDDEPLPAERSGRVSRFIEAFQVALSSHLGEAATVFFDKRAGVHGVLDQFTQAATSSAVMLAILSPSYIRSEWTLAELKSFSDSNQDRSRLFVVEFLPPAPDASYSDEIYPNLRVKFWHEQRETGVSMPLEPNSKKFREAILKLASDVAGRLTEMRGPSSKLSIEDLLPVEPSPPAAPSPDHHDRYRTQADDPARVDALERGPFAAILAKRIVEIRESQRGELVGDDRAFMVHLHGPWGSGKSSLLYLLEQKLQVPEGGASASLVVWFNAWKHQRMRPPWWALLAAIYKAATQKNSIVGNHKRRFRRRAIQWLWWKWRLRADLLPGVLVAVLLGGVSFVLVGENTTGEAETLLKIALPLIAIAATLTAYARLIAFGSDKAAKTYADLTSDPFSPVVRLFHDMVGKIPQPLVVFIEDVDRCDSDYVVELLEGIQTLLREAAVTYVVAADRKWICTSFDKKYGDFCGSIGEPCRPLGYLFVDKIFQISAGMPRLTRDLQARYLAALLAEGEPEIPKPSLAVSAAATERVRGITDEAAMERAIAESSSAPIAEQRAIRAAAALQITSAEAARETEHRLQKFSHLLEPNPRSMKRLVNAVGMAQARGFLEGRVASPETRARWMMLTLRWPVFADFISENPETIRHWVKRDDKAHRQNETEGPESEWPNAIRDLQGNKALRAVIGEPDDEGALTPESLEPLLS